MDESHESRYRHRTDASYGAGTEPTTLAEFLFRLSDPKARAELEQFRIAYENATEPTDLRLRYTSTWDIASQEWLLKHHAKRYWDGLPPFVQAYFREKLKSAASAGQLDDVPEPLRNLFLKRLMGSSHPDYPGRA
jgi:hypothetical protein